MSHNSHRIPPPVSPFSQTRPLTPLSSSASLLSFVCPLCRNTSDGAFRFWKLRLQEHNLLRCMNPSCRGRYTTLPYPIILREPGAVFDRLLPRLDELHPSALGMILQTISEDSFLFEALCRRSTYLWTHFHDLLPESYRPNVVHPAPFPLRALSLLDELDLKPIERVLVAGCGPGREAMELAHTFQRSHFSPEIFAFDIDPVLLTCFHTLQATGQISFLPRSSTTGWHSSETITLPNSLQNAAQTIQTLCGDILDPPFEANSLDLVVALNLFDNVRDPLLMIAQINAMLKPGGYLLLSTPFAWNSTITPPEKQPSNALSRLRLSEVMRLEKILSGVIPIGVPLKYHPVAVQQKVSWFLRIHDTQLQTYLPYLALWQKAP